MGTRATANVNRTLWNMIYTTIPNAPLPSKMVDKIGGGY